MDFDAYARTAVALVNARSADVAHLLPAGPGEPEPVSARDLAVLRRARRQLRGVFEYGSTGRDTDVVAGLNALLDAHPVRPRISGHDATDWHMHVTAGSATLSAEYLAGAIWGLAVWVCRYGSARFGVCADDRCRDVYLDTSSNNCRRFCSERCATRSHVAAHRARKRALPAAAPASHPLRAGRRGERGEVSAGKPERLGQV